MVKTTLIPAAELEEYRKRSRTRGVEDARALLFARLQMSKGRAWWLDNRVTIREILDQIDKEEIKNV